MHKSQFFPPGRSILCNKDKNGPTVRPYSNIGGHSCCNDADLCNLHLKPVILDYRTNPPTEWDEGWTINQPHVFFLVSLQYLFFLYFFFIYYFVTKRYLCLVFECSMENGILLSGTSFRNDVFIFETKRRNIWGKFSEPIFSVTKFICPGTFTESH